MGLMKRIYNYYMALIWLILLPISFILAISYNEILLKILFILIMIIGIVSMYTFIGNAARKGEEK